MTSQQALQILQMHQVKYPHLINIISMITLQYKEK